MMSIDHGNQLRSPRRQAPRTPRPATPCAGLFGWRKDEPRRGKECEEAERDYPAD